MFKVLDLFCGCGGASMGIHQALEENGIEHEIIGIDIRKMSDYPFQFYCGDIFNKELFSIDFYKSFDFIWASPPCQAYSKATKQFKGRIEYPDLIDMTRELLLKTKKPFCIENVPGSPLREDLILCGTMFNLKIYRHRIFEVNFVIYQPYHPIHKELVTRWDSKNRVVIKGKFECIYGKRGPPGKKGRKRWQKALGIFHTDRYEELSEAIPPAYSKYIMNQYLMKHPTLMDYIEV